MGFSINVKTLFYVKADSELFSLINVGNLCDDNYYLGMTLDEMYKLEFKKDATDDDEEPEDFLPEPLSKLVYEDSFYIGYRINSNSYKGGEYLCDFPNKEIKLLLSITGMTMDDLKIYQSINMS